VSADINSTLDLDEICEWRCGRWMNCSSSITRTSSCSNRQQDIESDCSRGYENQAVGGRVPVGTGVIGMVAQKRQMMHVNNLGRQRA
jgi:hypothetical protein